MPLPENGSLYAADQHRRRDAEMQGGIGGGESDLVIGDNDRNTPGAQRLRAMPEFGEASYYLLRGWSDGGGHILHDHSGGIGFQ